MTFGRALWYTARMPSLRRLLIATLLLVAIGAIVNVSVAWSIAAFGEFPQLSLAMSFTASTAPGEEDSNEIELSIDGRTSSDEAALWHIGLDEPRGGCATIRAGVGQWHCWEAHFTSGRTAATAAFGWPFPGVRTVVAPQTLGAPAPAPVLPAPAFLTDRGLFERSSGAIPISPVFPGALYNTLIYTAALAPLLLLIPLRRAHRRRRGRCPRCNYDMRGIEGGCPECGSGR